jgi:hypothetical protein
MPDKLISQLEEGIPATTDFGLYDPDGSGYYKKFQMGNAPSGGGSGATTLSTPSLSASGIDADTIRLTIGTVANETNIEIQRSNDGSTGWSTISTSPANTTTYDDDGIAASTTRYYRVRAVGDGVTYLTSGWSSVANGTTTAGGGSYDADAQSLFTAATTDPAFKDAINQLYLDIKAEPGLYAEMYAMYFLFNSAAAKDKFNGINPLDTDAAHRLEYTTNTHTSTGMTGVAKTNFNGLTDGWSGSSRGITFYNQTNQQEYSVQMGAAFGPGSPTVGIGIVPRNMTDRVLAGSDTWNNDVAASTNGKGCWTVFHKYSTLKDVLYKDGVLISDTINSYDIGASARDAMVTINDMGNGPTGDTNLPTTNKTSFAAIHGSLTDSQAIALQNAIIALHTTLGIL